MRLSVLEGSLAQVFLNWTTGSVLTGYMLHLGASANQLALVASVPLLAQAASPLAAYLVTNLGHRKLFTMLGAGLGRGLWALAVLLPQLGVPEPLQPTFLVLCVLISSVFLSSNATLWSSWMADIVPAHRRGAYFGLRTGVIGVIGMLGNLLAGALLDRLAAPLSFQLVLGIAVISGLLGMLLYLFHHDPPVSAARHSLAKLVQVPLRDANFRRFLLFATYWQFSVFIAAPFVFPYFLDELGMSFTQTAIWSVIALTFALGTTIFWGRIADQSGNKAVLGRHVRRRSGTADVLDPGGLSGNLDSSGRAPCSTRSPGVRSVGDIQPGARQRTGAQPDDVHGHVLARQRRRRLPGRRAFRPLLSLLQQLGSACSGCSSAATTCSC